MGHSGSGCSDFAGLLASAMTGGMVGRAPPKRKAQGVDPRRASATQARVAAAARSTSATRCRHDAAQQVRSPCGPFGVPMVLSLYAPRLLAAFWRRERHMTEAPIGLA